MATVQPEQCEEAAPQKPLLVYGVTLAVVAAAVCLRLVLEPVLVDRLPFFSLLAAVVFASWYGGRGPAVVALLVGAVAAAFFILRPHYSLAVATVAARVDLVLHVLVCCAALAVFDRLDRVRQKFDRERRRLRESEERFRGIFTQTLVGIAETDLTGRFIQTNQRYCEIVGRAADELLCLRMQDITHPDDLPRNLPLFERAAADGTPFVIEKRYVRPDGAAVWVSNSVSLIRDGRGRPRQIVAASLDITAGKQAEAALRDSEAHFRSMADNAPTMLWVTDSAGACTYLSSRWYEFTGTTPAQCLGLGWLECVHADDRRQAADIFLDANRRHVPFSLDYRIRRHDGAYRWAVDAGLPRFDADGRFVGFVGTVTDVHERKQAEQAVRASEERFRTLFESMDEGFCVVEMEFDSGGRPTDYRIVEMNPAFERHTGLQSILGRSVRQAVPGLEEFWFETYGRVAQTGEPTRFEHRAVPLGERWFDVYAFRLGGAGSNKVAILFTDISARKRAEEQLREADRRKDEFLATLAHELRNPLAPLRNGLEVMKMAGTDPEAVEQARAMMERQLGQMVHLIEDLMDLSRISRGKVQLRKSRVELAKVVQQALETSRPLIEERGHTFTFDVPKEPLYVDADTTRLAQVFANLLNNAAKYTDCGGHVALRVARQGGEAVVSVKDNGVGIPAAMLPKVFEMFTQVDRSLEKAQGGLGIGLSLVKQLVEMHGGGVAARSDGHGRGSEFVVTLPLALTPAQADGVADTGVPGATAARRRILVADDNVDAAASLGMLLRLMGNEVRTAHDGAAAVEAAEAFRPDVALLDIGMPKLNGLEACRRIRAQPWGGQMVLVALTGWGQEDDRRQTREAGFDHHVVKPVDPAKLEQLLATLKPTTTWHGHR